MVLAFAALYLVLGVVDLMLGVVDTIFSIIVSEIGLAVLYFFVYVDCMEVVYKLDFMLI